MTHADDHDLAQPAGKGRLPSRGIGVIEPALGERWAVEQHAINVDQSAAPAGAKFFDEPSEFGMLLLLDQGHSSHEYLHRVSGPQTAKIGLGVTFGVTPKTPQEARWRVSRVPGF
jgi:hypothetical protein